MRFLREGESNITQFVNYLRSSSNPETETLVPNLLMETTKQYRRRPIRKRRGRRRKNAPSIDRLSVLPDEILSHILSFLSTKTAATTSVLAKRWRSLWQFIPNLVFDSENHDRINRVLLLHQLRSIISFRLLLGYNFSGGKHQIETWIITVIARNVQEIHLYFNYKDKLPVRLFTCKTLVELELDECGVIPRSVTVCLPRLKRLRLTSVRYEAHDPLPNLLSGCPVLEDLKVGYIMDHDLVCCNISSPSIKRLTVRFEFSDGIVESYNHDYRVKINTPALEYLFLTDYLSEHIESGDLTSLVEATFTPYNDNYDIGDESLYRASVFEFIDRLSNVECLKMDISYFDWIVNSVSSAWTVSFNNLTKLELKADCEFLMKFLESADNLQILSFWQVPVTFVTKDWREPQQIPPCLLSHLKTISLLELCDVSILGIARYLFRNGRVLEGIEISFAIDIHPQEKNEMREEIESFELGSETCELVEID